MTKEVIQAALAHRPFRPFSVRLPSGMLIKIPSEDYAALHPNGETMIIFTEEGGYRVLDVALISELQGKKWGGAK